MESFHLKYKANEIPIEEAFFEKALSKGIEIKIKRLDLVHPLISGNKYFKLKYNLLECIKLKKKGLLSFGGAYSNHILAIARAASLFDIQSIGFIRGEELGINFLETLKKNKILREAHFWKMQFAFIDRSTYRARYEKEFLSDIQKKYPEFYILPEGGTNELAIKGVGKILDSETSSYNYICTPIGSGGTFLGLLAKADAKQKVLGFSALKKADFIKPLIEKYNLKSKKYCILEEYHFGGFSKSSKELVEFSKDFKEKNFLELDFTYNAKMLYGIKDLIKKGFFEKGARILIIYTLSKSISIDESLSFLQKLKI